MSRPAAVELLAALAAALRRRRRRWYVFGAQAAVAYGRPRMTADVDVTVEADNMADVLRDLEAAGFRRRDPRLDELMAQARVLPLVHERTSMPIDVVLAGPGLEQEFLERATLIDIGGLKVPMISAEDLLVTKILAGRPKDLDDVLGILLERLRLLDLERTRTLLGALEDALDRSDLRPTLQRLVAEAEAARPVAATGRKGARKGPRKGGRKVPRKR